MSTGYPWLSLLVGHRREIEQEIASMIRYLSGGTVDRSLVVSLHTLNMGLAFGDKLPVEVSGLFDTSDLPPQLQVQKSLTAGDLEQVMDHIAAGNRAVIEKIDSAQTVSEEADSLFKAKVSEAVQPGLDSVLTAVQSILEDLESSRDREERLDLACDVLGEWLNDHINLERRFYGRTVDSSGFIGIGRFRDTQRLLSRFEAVKLLFPPDRRQHLQDKANDLQRLLTFFQEQGSKAVFRAQPQVTVSPPLVSEMLVQDEDDRLPATELIKPDTRQRRNREIVSSEAADLEEKGPPRPIPQLPVFREEDDLEVEPEEPVEEEEPIIIPPDLQPGTVGQTIGDFPVATSLRQLRDQLPDDNGLVKTINNPDDQSAPEE